MQEGYSDINTYIEALDWLAYKNATVSVSDKGWFVVCNMDKLFIGMGKSPLLAIQNAMSKQSQE